MFNNFVSPENRATETFTVFSPSSCASSTQNCEEEKFSLTKLLLEFQILTWVYGAIISFYAFNNKINFPC